jgi:tetratricopeptide (TPR) repeat protein
MKLPLRLLFLLAAAVMLAAAAVSAGTPRELWESLDRAGAQAGAGRDEALLQYRQALAVAEREALATPADAAWQGAVLVSALKVGRLLAELDRRREALTIFGQAIAAANRLADERRDQPAILWRQIGAALVELRRSPTATASFEQALSNGDTAKRSLLVVYGKVGGALWDERDFVAAVEAYKAARALAKERAASGNALAEQDLALADDAVGTAYMALNYSGAALEYLQEALTLRQRFADAAPDAPRIYDLAYAYERIGQAFLRRRNLPESLKDFETALSLRQRGMAMEPGSPLWEVAAANSYGQVGTVLVLLERKQEAKENFRKGRELAVKHRMDTDLFDKELSKLE